MSDGTKVAARIVVGVASLVWNVACLLFFLYILGIL